MKPFHSFAALLVAASSLLFVPSCSLVVDSTLAGHMPSSGCAIADDGTPCTVDDLIDNRICVEGTCVPASCGDGFLESRMAPGGTGPEEICDDGNDRGSDGCEPDCTFTCDADEDCSDGNDCTGTETCGADHVCAAGTTATDGTPCTVESMAATCQGGICRAGVCPDGMVDAGEECDDDNDVDGDGCDADCTFSCETDEECQNDDACDGAEVCGTVTPNVCASGTALMCDDEDDCTTDTCDGATGCVFASVFVDADMDGFTVAMAGAPASCVSQDCDDTDENIYPGAPEACGATMDMNCDGATTTPVFYADCDGDGFAASGAISMMSCTTPSSRPSTCSSGSAGRWTSVRPSGTSSTDCADGDAAARPGQTAYFGTAVIGVGGYDFNCDGRSTTEYPAGRPRDFVECSGAGRTCSGTIYWTSSTVTCGSHSGTLPSLSHCELNLLSCTRTSDPTATVRCH